VKYVAHGTRPNGEPYLAMEWVDGEDLSVRLGRSGLTIVESVAAATAIAEALGALHRAQLVHRDLKPSNVMFERGDVGRVKLIDFGVSRAFGDRGRLTNTGMIVGTPGYMAPEQARGERAIDARADVFALGSLLYACLTGWRAFQGEHTIAVCAKIVLADPEPLRGLCQEAPAGLIALVDAMLAKDREHRPRDGDAVARALRALGALPDGPRRPTRVVEAPTAALSPPRDGGALLVLAGVPGEVEPLAPDAVTAIKRRIAAIDGSIAVELLEGGAVLAHVPIAGDFQAAARLARACAGACQAELPELAVAIANAGARPNAVAEAIDRAVRGLFDMMLLPGSRSVWLDEPVLAHVDEPPP